MTKLKIGDRVKVLKDPGSTARILTKGSVSMIVGSVSMIVRRNDYREWILEDDKNCSYDEDDLELINSNTIMEKYKIGDMLVNEDGDERMILAVCGNIVALSWSDDFNLFSDWYTEEEITDHEWTLKSESTDETIDLMGKRYKVKEVEKALKNLKAIE